MQPQAARDDFLSAVLAIDDFGLFKAAMLDLKRDLLGCGLHTDALDQVKWKHRHTALADF